MNFAGNTLLPTLVTAVVVTSALALTGGGYDLTWNTFDGGGATFSTGGGYELGGTIGQPDAGGPMTGGGYELTGGFWPGATGAVVPPSLVSAVSRRLHGAAGVFDIGIALTGATREPRQNGSAPQLILTMAGPPSAVDGTINCGAEVVVANGTCNSVSVSGNDLIVNMTFNKNACVTVTLNGLNGFSGDNNVSILTHEGDVQSLGTVNILDLQAIKNQLNQPLNASTFRLDVTVNGVINILDLQAVKNNLNVAAPACP